MNNDFYQSPLVNRYASQEMAQLFSPKFKFTTWRRLWIALAEAEAELGLPISSEQIDELKMHAEDINFAAAAEYEAKFNHDVMAHIHAYSDQCPKARSIIHLGATSCYVTDNTELMQIREGLKILISRLKTVIKQLANFAQKYADQPCLGFTHFQPAQPTTLGKRVCLWLQDLLIDLCELESRKDHFFFLGAKAATGTQASFLALFNGDHDKVKQLEKKIAEKMGFEHLFIISGQTYTRKVDVYFTSFSRSRNNCSQNRDRFAAFSSSERSRGTFRSKTGRFLCMPYKRNPILSERVCGLARFLNFSFRKSHVHCRYPMARKELR